MSFTILSLFDGCSCARQFIHDLEPDAHIRYYASEIDRFAETVSAKNFPDTVRLGDVRDVSYRDGQLMSPALASPTGVFAGEIHLLVGGSPCQDLSVAKKDRKGLQGEKSGLFWEYVRILREASPRYFLLENVASMPKHEKETITAELGVEPVMINSALTTAQNRKRLYWLGRRKADGSYETIPVDQPLDRGVLLRDVLEDIPLDDPRWKPVPEKYLSERAKLLLREKALCLAASYQRKNAQNFFESSEGQIVTARIRGIDLRIHVDQKKVQTLTGQVGTGGNNVPVAIMQIPRGKNPGNAHVEKAPTMNASDYPSNNRVVSFDPILMGNVHPSGRGMNGRLHSVDGKSPTLTTNKGEGPKISDGYAWRKLTPTECERLQGLPD